MLHKKLRSRTRSTSSSFSGSRVVHDVQLPRAKKPTRLTELECSLLLDVFTYFDTDFVGRLPKDDVYRICCMLRLNIARSSIPATVKRSEFVAFVDNNMIAGVGPAAETEVLATTISNGIYSPSTQPAEKITARDITNFLEKNNVAHSAVQVDTFVELFSPYDQVRDKNETDGEPPYVLAEDFIEGVAHTMAMEAMKFETRRQRSYSRY
jgi:hypothetical protein